MGGGGTVVEWKEGVVVEGRVRGMSVCGVALRTGLKGVRIVEADDAGRGGGWLLVAVEVGTVEEEGTAGAVLRSRMVAGGSSRVGGALLSGAEPREGSPCQEAMSRVG